MFTGDRHYCHMFAYAVPWYQTLLRATISFPGGVHVGVVCMEGRHVVQVVHDVESFQVALACPAIHPTSHVPRWLQPTRVIYIAPVPGFGASRKVEVTGGSTDDVHLSLWQQRCMSVSWRGKRQGRTGSRILRHKQGIVMDNQRNLWRRQSQ